MNKRSKDALATITEVNPTATVIDGFDDCIIGVCETYKGAVLLYDESLIIKQLKKEMSEEEAWNYYEENILGMYWGEFSPVFLTETE